MAPFVNYSTVPKVQTQIKGWSLKFRRKSEQRENYPQLKFEFESSLETQIYEALMAHDFEHVMSLLR